MDSTTDYLSKNDTSKTVICEPHLTDSSSEASFYRSLDSKHDKSFKRPSDEKVQQNPGKKYKSQLGVTEKNEYNNFSITPPDWEANANAWAYLQSQSPKYKNKYFSGGANRERKGYMIGRTIDCDIVLTDRRISKNHCLIYMEAGSNATKKGIRIFLKDLSSNGTYVNNEKVDRDQRYLLRSGDIIQLFKSHADNDYVDDRYSFYRIMFPCAFDVQLCKEDYDIKERLGSGSFASVYLANDKKTKKSVAIKVIDKKRFARNKRLLKTINDETVVMMAMESHPCAVGINHVYNEESRICLILDFVKDGELFNYVVEKQKLTEEETRFIFWQLFMTIKWLHNKQITHRDLKPENILLADKEKLHVKITDFGLAKILAKGERLDGQCGTPHYIAPEILDPAEERAYGIKCDMWSLGVMLYICLSGYPPFNGKSHIFLTHKLK
ncbi:unnamed protein product [Rhizopus stolonifer]